MNARHDDDVFQVAVVQGVGCEYVVTYIANDTRRKRVASKSGERVGTSSATPYVVRVSSGPATTIFGRFESFRAAMIAIVDDVENDVRNETNN